MRDYYDDDDRRYGSGKKKKHKGHQGRRKSEGEVWAEVINSEATYIEEEPRYEQPIRRDHPQRQERPVENKPVTFVFGPNTHTVRGVQIDFDRVDKIEQISSEHMGRTTYGIRFVFTGNKGLERKIWFNTNLRERDQVYAREYLFWMSLKKNK